MSAFTPSAHPKFVTLLAGAAATVAVAIGACANPDTQTPTCDNNVDQFGIHPGSDNACEKLAACPSGVAADCCKGPDGGALTGNDLATCLHGYGDPGCSYLVAAVDGVNVSYTCSPTPPTDMPDAGSVTDAGDGG